MNIQRCKKCGTKFNYTDILDSSGWGFKPIVCRSCGSKYKLKMRYILAVAIILSFPILFLNQLDSFPTTLKISSILFYIIYMVLVIGIYPFIIRYSLKDLEI